jgi:2-polyprenyl-3-methyl-5-hydroxy-6-metoxy-1,4-benzoquinol methylase
VAGAALPLLGRLGVQGLLNEHVWAVDAAEQARVDELAAQPERLGPLEVMQLAAYRPLAGVPGSESWLGRGWTGPAEEVLREHVLAARQEAALQSRIRTLTPIRAGVSERVRGQYEASPYPRWRRVARQPAVGQIMGWRVPARPNVLFAGCGTGFHAIHAGQRYGPDARVLAVDLSRASLGYAMRKAREAGIGNMAFAQADLLELDGAGLVFDVIECSGVLHHLADPFEGAQAVVRQLRPGGLIKISLYSATGRTGLKPAKALAAGYAPETIRDLRQAIMAAPDGDPLRAAARFSDFYATSSCRDLLMHVQEHEMSIADLQRMLRETGLTFRGFQVGADVRAAYRARFPEDPEARDLDRWADFEADNPATFASMYQFWAVKAA